MSYPILFYVIWSWSWALRLGKFDLIVSAEGVLQSPCGAQALLRLSTLQTQVHLVLRGDGAEVQQQRFLLRNVFREESRWGCSEKLNEGFKLFGWSIERCSR